MNTLGDRMVAMRVARAAHAGSLHPAIKLALAICELCEREIEGADLGRPPKQPLRW